MNGLLKVLRDAQHLQKPDFVCASRTQNRAIEFLRKRVFFLFSQGGSSALHYYPLVGDSR
jgi:hypothetical protein